MRVERTDSVTISIGSLAIGDVFLAGTGAYMIIGKDGGVVDAIDLETGVTRSFDSDQGVVSKPLARLVLGD